MYVSVLTCVSMCGEAFVKGDTQDNSSEYRQTGSRDRERNSRLIDGDDKRLVERTGTGET